MPTLSYTGKRDGLADQPTGAAAAGDGAAEFTTGMAQQPSDSDLSNISDDVPLFAFDASNTDTLSGGRPKRKLKAIARFESMTFDKKAAHTKIGEGFACPRCSATCSYDAKECTECQLPCYYEAGIGVVVLKERKVDQSRRHLVQKSAAGGGGGEVGGDSGTSSMQQVAMQRHKKRQSDGKGKKRSHSPATKTGQSSPTIKSDTRYPAQPAEGLPHGWLFRRIPRSKGSRLDPNWYSPGERYKFRSKPDAQRFIQYLEENGGDERAAIQSFQNKFGRRWTPGPRSTAQGEGEASAARARETDADDKTDDRKMPAVPMAPLGAGAVGMLLHAAKLQRSKCDGEVVTIKHPHRKCAAAGCNRYKEARCDGYCKIHFEIFGPDTPQAPQKPSARMPPPPQQPAAPPPELPERKAPSPLEKEIEELREQLGEMEDLRQQLNAATKSNASLSNLAASLRGTNDELANLVSDKDDALQEAETTIAALRRDAPKDGDGDRVAALERSLATEQASVQDLKRRLGDAEKDVATLSQENESMNEANARLQTNLVEMTSQRDRQAAELQKISSRVAAIDEKVEEKSTDKEATAAWVSQVSELEKKLSMVSAERDELSGKLAVLSTAELMAFPGAPPSRNDRQSETTQSSVDEGQKQELLAQTERAKETVAALQAEKEELATKLQRVNASVGTMKLESEISLNKAETEIGTLKQQASKRMSQVYELTDQLSAALTEKEELETTLESTTNDLTQTQERVEAQRRKIPRLESSIASTGTALIADDSEEEMSRLKKSERAGKEEISRLKEEIARIEESEEASKAKTSRLEESAKASKATIARLKAEKAEAIAKSASLTDQLAKSSVGKAKLRAKLDSATEDLSQMQEWDLAQKTKIAQLESSAKRGSAQSSASASEESKATITRLSTEKAVAVAKTTRLEKTVDELHGRVERLSAELNASKAAGSRLKSEVAAANAKSDTFESRHAECLNELTRIISEKSRVSPENEATYKATITERNAELQTLSEALITSDSLVSTVTAERNELRGRVSQLQTTVNSLEAQHQIGQSSDHPLSAIEMEKNTLIVKLNECISWLDSKGDELASMIDEIKANVAKMRRQDSTSRAIGNTSTLDMNEILSRAEKIEQRLSEEEADVSKLISAIGRLEARVKTKVNNYRDQYLVTTKDCKSTLKQKRKKLEALTASIASCKVEQTKTDRAISPNHISDTSEKGEEGALGLDEDTKGKGKVSTEAQGKSEESGDVQLFAFDLPQEQYNWGRPKRKLKAIARFESMTFDKKAAHTKIGEGFACPRCSATCSYDSKECEDCHLKCYYEAGIGVVVLKERKVDTSNRRSTGFSQASSQKKRRQDRPKGGVQTEAPQAWTKIGHAKLLPDGGKEYPRDLSRVIDFIDAQCKKQEENVEAAREEWNESCKDGAEVEAAIEEENALYRRGIRERSRMADQERLEKLKFAEKVNEQLVRDPPKKRCKASVEETKLCSQPIVFSGENAAPAKKKRGRPRKHPLPDSTGLAENAGTCTDEDCQFCKKDLGSEIDQCRPGAPAIDSLLVKNTTTILNPPAGPIEDHFDSAKTGEESEDRLRSEEGKLEKLQNTKRRLEFIKSYNDGLVTNAWAGVKKGKLKRKSSN